MNKRRLGRGLDALFGRSYEPGAPDEAGETATADADAELVHVRIGEVDANPYQPRRTFDPIELAGLVESVRQHGVLQPVIVRRVGERYQLIAGERRLRAAQEAGLAELPAHVVEAEDHQVFEFAIIENLQRTDLNAIEKARAFRDYVERFGSTQDELAARLDIDRSTVSNFVRLLELPEAIQQAVEAGKLAQGHARALLAVSSPTRQHEICQRVIVESLSVRQVEAIVSSEREPSARGTRRTSPHKTSHVVELEGRLRERLGAYVEIRMHAKDRGQIVIQFASNEDFERIMAAVCGSPQAPAAAA